MKSFYLFTILIVLFSAHVKAQDIDSDIIAYYPFSGDAKNETGVAPDGDVQGATLTADRFGNENEAYAFKGSDYIEIAEGDADFNIKSNGYTVSLWIYPEANQINSMNYVLNLGRDSKNGWAFSYLSVPRFEIKLFGGDTYGSTRSYVYIKPDQWQHFVFVYEGGYVQMYVNGKQFLKEYRPNYNYATGHNFVIGANSSHGSGFTGKIDELKIYDRALSFLEVATLSENESSADAARKGTVFHADFENKKMDPEQLGYGYDAERGGSITVVENPKKDAVNSSDYVIKAKTPKSRQGQHSRAEYTSKWDDKFETKDKTHIYQWMVYFPEDYMVDVDTVWTQWQAIAQFVTDPCARYEDGFEDVICDGGGIFNEVRINRYDYDTYGFKYRALPDCNEISYTYPRGQWVKFTYQILWTTEANGFYKVWANEELLGEAYNVHTLPQGWREGECDLRWKVGLYDSWYDEDIDSVYYFIDNLETYIDTDVREVCPQCELVTTGTENLKFNNDVNVKLYPNPVTNQINISGLHVPAEILIHNMNGVVVKQVRASENVSLVDLPKGIYVIEIHTDSEVLVRRMIKI